MVKDRIGNQLEVGNLVEIKLAGPEVMAFVTEVKEGGIIAGVHKGGQRVTPGVVTLVATFTYEYDPSNPVLGNMARLVDPNQEAEKPLLN